MNETPDTVLRPQDPPPFTVGNESGTSPFFIVVDHAANYIPGHLHKLGLAAADCERHIAWDIGAGTLAVRIADALGAFVIRQNYSRLLIDCNRPPHSETSVVSVSELTPVPGNVGLTAAQKSARVREIFEPYHNRIALELDRRRNAGQPTILISMHSFTPVFKSVARSWHTGVLYNRDPRFAHILFQLLQREEGLIVGDNEPYRVSDESDYAIPIHGEKRGIAHVELEIRQDLIADESGQRKWAALLTRLLPEAGELLDRASASLPDGARGKNL